MDTTIDNNDKVEKVEDQESKKSPLDPSIATKPDTEMDTKINKNNKTILITMEYNNNDKKIGECYCTLAQIKNNLFRLTFSTESMEFFNKIRLGLQFTSEQIQKIIKNTIEECLQQLIENKEKKMTMQLDCETWAQFQIVVTRVETNDTYHVEIYQKTSIR